MIWQKVKNGIQSQKKKILFTVFFDCNFTIGVVMDEMAQNINFEFSIQCLGKNFDWHSDHL